MACWRKAMTDDKSQSQVQSPCRALCHLNAQSLCQGCFRTSSEISFWVTMSDEEKLEVIERAKLRELHQAS